jgi:hypothetical protein
MNAFSESHEVKTHNLHDQWRACDHLILLITAVALFTLALAPAVMAQSARDVERAENERDLDLRSWNLKVLQLQHERESKGRPPARQAVAQLQDDFARLQIANRNLLRAALSNNTLDLKFVSKSVAEIRKRAERLNLNLALPEVEKTSGQPALLALTSPQQLKPSVLRLGRLIFSFVDNPFFKEASVVDTQLTTKARRDLEDIIELSGQIKKGTQQLSKTGTP